MSKNTPPAATDKPSQPKADQAGMDQTLPGVEIQAQMTVKDSAGSDAGPRLTLDDPMALIASTLTLACSAADPDYKPQIDRPLPQGDTFRQLLQENLGAQIPDEDFTRHGTFGAMLDYLKGRYRSAISPQGSGPATLGRIPYGQLSARMKAGIDKALDRARGLHDIHGAVLTAAVTDQPIVCEGLDHRKPSQPQIAEALRYLRCHHPREADELEYYLRAG